MQHCLADNGVAAPADFATAVKTRRSVRGYLPQPVAPALLERIFALAQRAPSNSNTQPWKVMVVSGERRQQLCARLHAAAAAEQQAPDFPCPDRYDNIYLRRQKDAAIALYSALGLHREHRAAKHQTWLRNFTGYDAPHIAFVFMPDWCGMREAVDIGIYAQTLMLGLAAFGIGSCAETCLGFSADIVRAELQMPDSCKLLFGIAFGYADTAHPANRCRTTRAPVAKAVQFIG
jgi:nitroreductase